MTTEPNPNENSQLPKKAALLVNARSRRGAEWFGTVQKLLIDSDIDLQRSEAFKSGDLLMSAIRKSVSDKVPLVIVGGGDGTMGSAAQFFAGSSSVMGVLPLGTGNAFAHDLGIPADPVGASKVLIEGKLAKVDLGRIGDRCFLNVATLGLTTRIADALTNELKSQYGRASYLLAVVKGLAAVRPFTVRIEHDGTTEEFKTLQVVIGNGRYHAGPFPVAEDASITNGRLAIYALESTRKLDLLRMAIRLVRGKQAELPMVRSFSAERGRISAQPQRKIVVDGEPCLKTPAEFWIEPRSLPVIVPQEFEQD